MLFRFWKYVHNVMTSLLELIISLFNSFDFNLTCINLVIFSNRLDVRIKCLQRDLLFVAYVLQSTMKKN